MRVAFQFVLLASLTLSLYVVAADDPGSWKVDRNLAPAFPEVRRAIALVDVQTLGKNGTALTRQGTAVLVKTYGPDKDGGVIGEFITCYHVVQGARKVSLSRLPTESEKGNVASIPVSGPNPQLQIITLPGKDLASIRVTLKEPRHWQPVTLVSTPIRMEKTPLAVGFGFPEYAGMDLRGVVLRLGGEVSAGRYYPSNDIRPSESKLMSVLQANRETLPAGLSGGPLFAILESPKVSESGAKGENNISRKYQLVGLMFGSDPRGTELIIPAAEIQKLLVKSDWKPFTSDSVAVPVPFAEFVTTRMGMNGDVSDVVWSGLQGWEAALRDPLSFRDRFQEIVLDSATQMPGDKEVSIEVDKSCLRNNETIVVWANGAEWRFNGTGSSVYQAGQHLSTEGDSLIIVQKIAPERPIGSLDLTQMLTRTNDLRFTVRQGKGPGFTIRRALPDVLSSYSVYLTFRHPSLPDEDTLQPDEQVRLAVRMDAIQRFLNEIPFTVPVDEHWLREDGSQVVTAKADLVFAPPPLVANKQGTNNSGNKWRNWEFVGLNPRTGQTLDLSIRGRVEKLSASVPGIGFDFEEPHQSMAFEFRGRLQATRHPGNQSVPFHTVIRATGAAAGEDLRVPLLAGKGFKVTVDISSLVSEFGLQWLNNHLLRPGSPRAYSSDSLSHLLDSIGGRTKGVFGRAALRRVTMREVGGHTWLIITMALSKTDVNGKKSCLRKGGFLPDSKTLAEDLTVDLLARDDAAAVPLLLLSQFRATNVQIVSDPSVKSHEINFKLLTPSGWIDAPPTLRCPVKAVGPALSNAQTDALKVLLQRCSVRIATGE